MSRPASSREPRRVARGFTWVSALLIVLVAGAAYLGWVWLPVEFDHYTVRQTVEDYMNQAIKNPDDAGLVRAMCAKIRSLRSMDGVDASGNRIRVPAVVLDEQAVTWQRDTNAKPPTLRVAFEYERQVVYPLIDRVAVKTYRIDQTKDMTTADWGPPR